MAKDALSIFTSLLRSSPPEAPAPKAALPSSLTETPAADGRMAYVAFENEVRARNVEIRCWRSGLSYSIAYAHMSGIVCEFISGEKLSFEGNGYGFIIRGRNAQSILLALNLHTCGFIQDFHPQYFIQPEPVDPAAAFVESIEVQVLYSASRGMGSDERAAAPGERKIATAASAKG